jgi:hypothetical protein
MGSSAAILSAGYNIDSLMLRYQGVDWRNRSNWGCNAGINPYADHMYDGVNISPFEVMFVKVKEFLLEAGWATASHAKKYSAWMRGQFNLTANEYTERRSELRNMKIINMRARGRWAAAAPGKDEAAAPRSPQKLARLPAWQVPQL